LLGKGPTYGLFSLVYVVPMSIIVFKLGRGFRYWSATFDEARQTITTRWGLFVPFVVREYRFHELSAIQLNQRTVHEYHDVYTVYYLVYLRLIDGASSKALEYTDFHQSWSLAERLAVGARLPLVDATVEPPQLIPAGQVGQPLRRPSRQPHVKPLLPLAPYDCRCTVRWEDTTGIIRLPLPVYPFLVVGTVKFLGVLVLLTFCVCAGALLMGRDVPGAVSMGSWIAIYVFVPLFVVGQVLRLLFGFSRTTITVDDVGLHFRMRALLYGSTIRIPHEELKSIRLDNDVVEIIGDRDRIRFGDHLTATERHWVCDALHRMAVGSPAEIRRRGGSEITT
jgi:hypothetical protein